jgi:hypothetical protein
MKIYPNSKIRCGRQIFWSKDCNINYFITRICENDVTISYIWYHDIKSNRTIFKQGEIHYRLDELKKEIELRALIIDENIPKKLYL